MLIKIFSVRTLLLILLTGALASTAFSFYLRSVGSLPNDLILIPSDIALLPKQQERLVLPVRLKIPLIGVDSVIVYAGLTSEGAMDVPKGPAEVSWFSFGVRPGDVGSAVIAGHFGWKDDIPAVFDRLHELQKGDKLYVEDEKGKVVTFVVREIRSYDPKADASGVFGSNDGKAHLNLVTCEGAWNIFKKSRPSRIVVFSDKE